MMPSWSHERIMLEGREEVDYIYASVTYSYNVKVDFGVPEHGESDFDGVIKMTRLCDC